MARPAHLRHGRMRARRRSAPPASGRAAHPQAPEARPDVRKTADARSPRAVRDRRGRGSVPASHGIFWIAKVADDLDRQLAHIRVGSLQKRPGARDRSGCPSEFSAPIAAWRTAALGCPSRPSSGSNARRSPIFASALAATLANSASSVKQAHQRRHRAREYRCAQARPSPPGEFPGLRRRAARSADRSPAGRATPALLRSRRALTAAPTGASAPDQSPGPPASRAHAPALSSCSSCASASASSRLCTPRWCKRMPRRIDNRRAFGIPGSDNDRRSRQAPARSRSSAAPEHSEQRPAAATASHIAKPAKRIGRRCAQ